MRKETEKLACTVLTILGMSTNAQLLQISSLFQRQPNVSRFSFKKKKRIKNIS